jgi:hypothetical protein
MENNNKNVKSQIASGASKSLRIIVLFIFSASLFILFFFLIPNTCENDFQVYPEKGYCEFNLKTCEGLFGCKEYSNVQVPCGSVSTLCGEKILCDCGGDEEALSYSVADVINVLKEDRPFSYTSEQLMEMSDECGVKHDVGYFDKLALKFNNSMETVYSFKYKDDNQDSRAFIVTLLPNKAEYSSLEEFKKDFDLCFAGGDLYPVQLNSDWLLFVSSCGSGVLSDGSCDEIKKTVEPSLKLN